MPGAADAARVVVVGSANVDLVLDVPRLPRPGETLLAGQARRAPGGKGANQAVAAARDGCPTTLVAAVGTDEGAAALRGELAGAGVETSLLRAVAGPTGLAVVLLDPAAQNAIVVAPGANAELTALTAADLAAVEHAAVLLCQLEVPLPSVASALSAARAAGVLTVLNAAPSRPLPAALWAHVDVLVVNEQEARDLAEEPELAARTRTGTGSGTDPVAAARLLLVRVPSVVVTLGSRGAVWLDRTRPDEAVAAEPVQPVDTTGAGDTFCGVLAAALARGASPGDALRRAVAAAGLSVQVAGAIPSVPTAAATDARLRATGAAGPPVAAPDG